MNTHQALVSRVAAATFFKLPLNLQPCQSVSPTADGIPVKWTLLLVCLTVFDHNYPRYLGTNSACTRILLGPVLWLYEALHLPDTTSVTASVTASVIVEGSL